MPFEIFISYSHRDRKLRDELVTHLSTLRRQGLISNWYDGDINAGTEWKEQIMEHLNSAHIIVLLISAHFIASDFCHSIELQEAMARHDAHKARVIPVIIRTCDWQDESFVKLKVLPTDGKPVDKWSTHDEAFTDVVKGIRKVIQDLSFGTTPIS